MSATSTAADLPPGPSEPAILQAFKFMRKPAELLEQAQARYGDVWTMKLPGGSRNIIVADPELAQQIFAADTGTPLAGASPPFARTVFGDRSVLMLDGPDHAAQRKLIEPPFHRDAVSRYREQISRVCDAEIDSWPLNQPVALLPLLRGVALKMILSVALGATTKEAQDNFVPEIQGVISISTSIKQLSLTWLAGLRGKPAPNSSIELVDALNAKLYPEIERSRQDPRLEERGDVLAMLVRARYDDGTQMSDREIRDEVVTLLLQGHTSTATTCAWAVERLVRHPDKMERLRAEAESGGDEYLNAVIRETLRVRPPLPLPTRRVLEPFQLGKWTIPAGPNFMVNTMMLQRRADLYPPDPLAFRPERFLERQAPPGAWVPFGGGTHGCPGSSFALSEVRVVLHTLALRTRLAPTEPADEQVRRRAVGFDPSAGARVVIKERVPLAGAAEVVAG